jgi:hypothetical protein
MTRRPRFSNVRKRPWNNPDGTTTKGIAIYKGNLLAAHLLPSEAYKLANRLVDLAEELERP